MEVVQPPQMQQDKRPMEVKRPGDVYLNAALEEIAKAEVKLTAGGYPPEEVARLLTGQTTDVSICMSLFISKTMLRAANNGFAKAEVLALVETWVNRGDQEKVTPTIGASDLELFSKWMQEKAEASGDPEYFLRNELSFFRKLLDEYHYPCYVTKCKYTIVQLLHRQARIANSITMGSQAKCVPVT